MTDAWYQDALIYQIYPRSFQDTNADGIGDLPGIIKRLDYLKTLEVDAIWLSPIFVSPMADFGYDVSDYRSIDPVFGTLEDCERLLEQAHKREIKVIFDMVLNHTSKEHPWFLESRTSRTNEKSDFYIWSDTIPNNWYAAFGGRAWTYDAERGQYYLHSFLADQPDLNWRNPKVVDAVFAELRYWLDKGVDGFRLDVINCIVKDETFRNNPKGFWTRPRPYDMQRHIFDRNRVESHKRLEQMRSLIDAYPQRMLVGEIMVELPGEPELAASYLGKNGDELNLCFDFSLANARFNAAKWKVIAKRWYEAVGKHRVPTWVLNNHDLPRFISRVQGNEQIARLGALFLLTQRGAVFLYYGEELGLSDSKVSRPRMYDPLGKHYWPFHPGRDPERGPMIWNTGEGYGFSEAEPWLPFAKSANRLSVENQELEEQSLLKFYRVLIQLRKADQALRFGITTFLDTTNTNIMAYSREIGEERRLIVLNFSKNRQYCMIPVWKDTKSICEPVFSTHPVEDEKQNAGRAMLLHPYQGTIYRLSDDR
ncbi:MAG: alpha-amylase family glycosyl hydrolase [Sphaerochaeta sp.]|jgi:alpha-glucosidase|uniref:alpha-amylase family glycosyl hydrolase n=1 Tax=Sphaerochaeta sp. TaxID=1972642 RepID=UPI002FCA9D6F